LACTERIILVATIAIMVTSSAVIGFYSAGLVQRSSETSPTDHNVGHPPVIIRIDDVQDYAFKHAQNYLLQFHSSQGIPADLSVIPGYLGDDKETIILLRNCIQNGSEISTHGWLHENLSMLDEDTQIQLLKSASEKLRKVLGVDSFILVPPMFSYNAATLAAMKANGYRIISSSVDQPEPTTICEGIRKIPATVELSMYHNSTWAMKTPDTIMAEVETSITQYGYAVIVLHPQEFIRDNTLDYKLVSYYEEIIGALHEDYWLTTFEKIYYKVQ
jgi:peptidoglycan/xylan/chitin deacetylase (PgdA/CDA1 family)